MGAALHWLGTCRAVGPRPPGHFSIEGVFAIKKATRSFTNILRNQSGGVAVYAAIFSMLGIGAGALAIDIGRMTLLRAETQN